jgi:predicted TIM-barrel fold metal-dependent hydrolase
LLIADSQVHIWAASTPERPWPARHAPHRPVPLGKDELLRAMDEAGVQRATLVPPTWEGERNDLVLAAAQAHPDRFGVMGRLDLTLPNAREEIAKWRSQPGMLGMRVTFKHQGHPDDDWLWDAVENAGVPVMMMMVTEQLPLIGKAAERHPGAKLTIDHLGIPKGTKDAASFAHLDALIALAKHPNIAVKVSSLPTYTTDVYPYRQLHGHIRRVYDAFGPQRMFWGTDYSKLKCTYRQAITMYTEEIPWLTASDKEWIMGRGLCEWIGWKLPQ